MPRVAYISCDTPAWFDIAVHMRDAEAWEPVYWIADSPSMPTLRSRFPNAILHDRMDAYHLINPPELVGVAQPPLDEPFLDAMSEAQVIAIKMMDVVDSVDAFDFNERRRFFRQRLRYWRGVLEALAPDVVVFAFSAHVVYDYAVYALCQHYGIRTLMFEASFDFALLFAMEDPMVGSTAIRDCYHDLLAADRGGVVALPPLYEQHLARLRGAYSGALPWYMKEQFEAMPDEVAAKMHTAAVRSTSTKARGDWWRTLFRTSSGPADRG